MRIPSIRTVSHQYLCLQYVSLQYVSLPYVTYPFNTYPFNTYPLTTYPFKKSASAGMAMYLNAKHTSIHTLISMQYASSFVSIPCVSIQYISIQKGMHQQELQCMWMQNISLHIIASAGMAMSIWVSLHVISYHCYSAGMAVNIKTLLFLQFLCNFNNWIWIVSRAYEHGIHR